MNLYETLGVNPDATPEEITKAYRVIAHKCHPDKNPDNEEAAMLFQEVTAARDILLDAQKRATYDLTGDILDSGSSPEAIANNMLATLFSVVYVTMCNKNSTEQNIIDYALNSVIHDLEQTKNKNNELNVYLSRMTAGMENRIIVPESMVNIAENVCKQKIKELNAAIKQGDEAIDRFNNMIEMLSHYEDRFCPKMVRPEFQIENADPDDYDHQIETEGFD